MANEVTVTRFITDIQAFYDKDYSEAQARLLERSFNGYDVPDEVFEQVATKLFMSLKWLPKPVEIIQAFREVKESQSGSPYTVATIKNKQYAVDDLGVIYFGGVPKHESPIRK